MTSSIDLAALVIDDFAPLRDSVFDMQTANGVVPLKLEKVGPVGASGRAGGAFALSFVAPAGPWLPQGIYPVRHPSLGAMDIFLVPVGPVPDGNGYHATFT